MSATGRLPRLLVSAALLLLAFTFFFPMIWMVMSSFKTNADIFAAPFALPDTIDFGRWVEAWEVGNLGQYAINSRDRDGRVSVTADPAVRCRRRVRAQPLPVPRPRRSC